MTTDQGRSPGTSDPAELADDEGASAVTPSDFAEPGGDAPLTSPASTGVGERAPDEQDKVGSTDAMTSSTGGLAGTSR